MARAFLVVMDSVGLGGAADADQFFNGEVPDTGANTLAHIAHSCAKNEANEGRTGPLHLPNLARLGLSQAMQKVDTTAQINSDIAAEGLFGVAEEISPGKDTPSGHWELAGVPVPWNWHYFPNEEISFDQDLLDFAAQSCQAGGTLCNRHGSGTKVIDDFAEEHIEKGWPIIYTSADSVLQIAAHEEHFGLQRLIDLCKALAPRLHEMKVGRVIARPFIGSVETGFTRTSNRKDFAIALPSPTLCDWAQDAGRHVYGIGKIGDIFSMQGINEVRKGTDAQLMEHLIDITKEAKDGSFTFANFVEFDTNYGHRRDIAGYATHLEWFDTQIPRIIEHLQADDLLIFTADHGNDPSWIGSDHTREMVPVVAYGVGKKDIGKVAFTDVAASIAKHLNIKSYGPGKSFL